MTDFGHNNHPIVGVTIRTSVQEIAQRFVYATSNPTVNDDSTRGFKIGYLWTNTSTGVIWQASDVSAGAANWAPAVLAGAQSVEFSGSGVYDAPQDYVGGNWINDSGRILTISSVRLYTEYAGTSGQTIADVLVAGTSVWNVTPANRPTLLASAGDHATAVGGALDTNTIAAGASMRVAIDEAQAGLPEDFKVIVHLF